MAAAPATTRRRPARTRGILRPYFFAGQLLTEDDLQQITTYQMGKRRLTNRYLFGAGVVCGLEVVVSPDPNTQGWVTVNPGYALDCCGEDIVLSCPYAIDINAMIRDEGLDCGDPCDESGGDSNEYRDYFLCVRYAEVPSDPVSPYSPNGTTSCVNTRVAEACTFELAARPRSPSPMTFALVWHPCSTTKTRPADSPWISTAGASFADSVII